MKENENENYELRKLILDNLNLAVEYFHAEQYKESIEVLEVVIELDLFHKTAFHLLGKNYMELGDYQKAIENFEISLSNYMYNKQCYIDLGNCYIKLGKKDEAKKIFKELKELAS